MLSDTHISKAIYKAGENLSQFHGDILFLSHTEEEAAARYKLAKFLFPQVDAHFLPSWDTVPYDRVSPNKYILADRAKTLSKIASRTEATKNVVVFTTIRSLLQKLPPREIFANKHLIIDSKTPPSQRDIINFLVASGFIRVSNATEPGEFAARGDILDITISSEEAYRLNIDWDNNCTIKKLDPLTQISSSLVEKFEIYPSSEIALNNETIEHFRGQFLTHFGIEHAQHPIYVGLLGGIPQPGMEHVLPLFYKNLECLTDYLRNPLILNPEILEEGIKNELESIEDFYQARLEGNKTTTSHFYPALPIEEKYFTRKNFKEFGKAEDPAEAESPTVTDFYAESLKLKLPVGDLIRDFVKKHNNKKIIIFCWSLSGLEKIKQLLKLSDVETITIDNINQAKSSTVSLTQIPLEKSLEVKEYILVRQQDVIGLKRPTIAPTSSKKLKNIIQELETLSEGELVVHAEHGIGQFMGIETIEVLSLRHDCMKILYADGDKLYIPVENLESVKKYGFSDVPLDKLGGVQWQKRKAKLKNRIGEVAAELIKVAATRKLLKSVPIFRTEAYEKFCAKFPYTETEDQLTTIADIENDLLDDHPMDRLVCGDVGFGKTEVAMRAAFLTTTAYKQVAIVAPTTILVRQHYASFVERFIGTNLKLAQLSRLTPRSEISKIKAGLADGSINVVIGTHALFANDIKFQDLGMLILDEEQQFGVVQKEKLKKLKASTHVLSLSATPIPRTLQMSMIGIRDLSLITTPPIDRLPIRTFVTPYDSTVIRDALMREHARGGATFYVCPRISDLEEVAKELTKIVPELKYIIAHGQMPPQDIDEIMGDFYDRKYDILLSTTIIGSGIDIPSVNTIIIHKAEMLGLSQLYQLRGRVGRGKIRGVAYLIIGNSKRITQHGLRRLEIMQGIDSLGAGFTIASYDADIRGFGNLVGDEQSGHIKEVGAELYHEMLEEAINKTEKDESHKAVVPNINIGVAVYLPEEYVDDSEQRLSLYKRISHLETEEIEGFRDELIDRFGPVPEPADNLLQVVRIKSICKKIGISDVDVGPNGLLLKFIPSEVTRDRVVNFMNKHPRHTKLRPDNKLVILPHAGQRLDVIAILSEM